MTRGSEKRVYDNKDENSFTQSFHHARDQLKIPLWSLVFKGQNWEVLGQALALLSPFLQKR